MVRTSRGLLAVLLLFVAAGACSKGPEGLQIPPGSNVVVQKKDGSTVEGRLVAVQSDRIVLENAQGLNVEIPKADVSATGMALQSKTATTPDSASAAQRAAEAAPAAPAPPSAPPAPVPGDRARTAHASAGASAAARSSAAAPRADAKPGSEPSRPAEPIYRELTVPAGTVLPVELRTSVASDSSHVEDPVRGTTRRALSVGDVEVFPAGTVVTGHVTDAERSGRVKGRARVALRFTSVEMPGEGRVSIRSDVVAREAEGTQKTDAAKIGGGAVGGAIIGGIIGGGDGAAKGAAIGGAAGTGVVLSTRGKEVRLPVGALLQIKLLDPVTVRVRKSN